MFKDVDSIPLGQDFRGHLNDIVGGCAAVLAIIGPRWIDTRNAAGQRRLEDPDDFVRIELEAALARNVPVVPVLVGHAPMPGTAELPTSLASMAFRQSIEVRPDPDFHNDATRLVTALRAIIDPDAPVPAPSASAARRAAIQACNGSGMRLLPLRRLLPHALAVPALRYLRQAPPAEIRTEISIAARKRVPQGRSRSRRTGSRSHTSRRRETFPRIWIRALCGRRPARPLARYREWHVFLSGRPTAVRSASSPAMR